jgi:hypothetical protein
MELGQNTVSWQSRKRKDPGKLCQKVKGQGQEYRSAECFIMENGGGRGDESDVRIAQLVGRGI